jgi:hypothetical protein
MESISLLSWLCCVVLFGSNVLGHPGELSPFLFQEQFLQDTNEDNVPDAAAAEDGPWTEDQIDLRQSAVEYDGISKRATGSLPELAYLRSDYQKLSAPSNSLEMIAKTHPVSAVFEAMENTQNPGSNCTESGYRSLGDAIPFPNVTHKPFLDLTVSALKTANVLNNLFRTYNASPASYDDAFFLAQVRATLETDSDKLIYGAAIAFEYGSYMPESGQSGGASRHFCGYVFRGESGELLSENVPTRFFAQRTGFEWFTDQRLDFSVYLRKYENICKEDPPLDPWRVNQSVATTAELGKWKGPYYKCKGVPKWIMTYSVPFFGCNKEKRIFEFR